MKMFVLEYRAGILFYYNVDRLEINRTIIKESVLYLLAFIAKN